VSGVTSAPQFASLPAAGATAKPGRDLASLRRRAEADVWVRARGPQK